MYRFAIAASLDPLLHVRLTLPNASPGPLHFVSLREINTFNYAHHMAHSWIPKHAYGEQYFPPRLGNRAAHRHRVARRGFRIPELAGIIRQATGVDVGDILNRWLAAPDDRGGSEASRALH